MPVQRLFFVFFRFIKESLLFQPHLQKSCKVLEGEKKSFEHILQYNEKKNMVNEGVQKKSCLHQITQQPSPLSCLKIKMVGA